MNNKPLFKKTLIVGLFLLPLPLLADGLVKQQAQTAVFDYSETIVPPQPRSLNDSKAEALTAKKFNPLAAEAVTPDGKLYTYEMTSQELRLLKNGVRQLSDSYEGISTGDGNKLIDNAGLERTAISTNLSESIIGADQRTRVFNTTAFPWRTMGRIALGCTGTLIGPRHVLTAGHCVYNTDTDRYYNNINFTPAQNGSSKPYGVKAWSKAIAPQGWTRDHNRNYDYALIVLKERIGNQVGWLGYANNPNLPKYTVNISGYPGDKVGSLFATMWRSSCPLVIIQSSRLYYDCDTYPGHSGSAVYAYFPTTNKRIIYGIHAYSVDSTGHNGGTRITQSVFNTLTKWKSDNP
jgi:glutamyl endopeptidase